MKRGGGENGIDYFFGFFLPGVTKKMRQVFKLVQVKKKTLKFFLNKN